MDDTEAVQRKEAFLAEWEQEAKAQKKITESG